MPPENPMSSLSERPGERDTFSRGRQVHLLRVEPNMATRLPVRKGLAGHPLVRLTNLRNLASRSLVSGPTLPGLYRKPSMSTLWVSRL